MPTQVTMPIPIPTGRKNSLQVLTDQGFFASLSATLASKDNSLVMVRSIKENDYTVPAPPPPSPVSFRINPEQWQKASRR